MYLTTNKYWFYYKLYESVKCSFIFYLCVIYLFMCVYMQVSWFICMWVQLEDNYRSWFSPSTLLVQKTKPRMPGIVAWLLSAEPFHWSFFFFYLCIFILNVIFEIKMYGHELRKLSSVLNNQISATEINTSKILTLGLKWTM